MDILYKRILIIVSLLLAALITAAVIIAVDRSEKSKFTPPPHEENAVAGVPENVDEALQYGRLALSDKFIVAVCGSPVIDSDGKLLLYFTSDESNEFFVRLIVLTENGEQLGATGLLNPGEYVESVILDPAPEEGQSVVLKILSYQPDTYYSMGSASVNVAVR